MELTKEYFDEQLKNAVAPLATKADVREGVEELARVIANTVATPMQEHFDQLHSELSMRERLEHVESDLYKIKMHLHISNETA